MEEVMGNTIRLTKFLVCKGDDVSDKNQQTALMVVQRLHRDVSRLPEPLMTNTQKKQGKRFLKWFELLETHEQVPEGCFDGAKFIVVEDIYTKFVNGAQTKDFLKKHGTKGAILVNLCQTVVLKTEHIRASGTIKKKDFQLVNLRQEKPQNYLEMADAVLELIEEGVTSLPEPVKGIALQRFTVLPEFAPDSKNSYGAQLPLEITYEN
ncbi:hypothetical protein ACQKM1_09420 [Peribacillus frigoritolerans]|uniref:hypothetical protein n=1 Tax=Peribacillus frigoritolerans TaxID=450367 RepID=UPI003CFCA149